jgi:CubicO group peptidase (beta-lactamase class C family)
MKRANIFLAAFLLSSQMLLAANHGAAMGASLTTTTDPASEVGKLVKDFDGPDTPGGVILVMRDGQIIYSHAFGTANLTHGIPFEVTTPTNIGSTSKQFTGFAIALLEERGLLSMEDDIRKHIPELPDLGHTVRLKHLLSHTSGYREYLNSFAMTGRSLNDRLRREEIVPLVQRQPGLQNEPGEAWLYNNTGFALLAMVVEKVTGEPFPGWMKENVFEPLGMTHTQVRDFPSRVIPGNAQGYTPDAEGVYFETQDIHAVMGAGGIYTTVGDLAKWISNFFEPGLGSPGLIQKMQTPFVLNNGDPTTYGLGLIIDGLGGLKRLQHGGADAAHRSQLYIFPEIRGAVITQSNNASFPGNVADKVAGIFFRDVMQLPEKEEPAAPGEFVFDPEKFDDYAGRYELEAAPGFILEFTREEEKLFTQATGQPKFEILASSDSTFYLTVVEASMTFHRNQEGIVDALTLHQNGNHRAKRVLEPKWEPSEDDIADYLGRYFSEELETFYAVARNEEGKLVLRHRRLPDIPLSADKEDVYTGAFPISEILFIRDEGGRVTGFKASSGRSFGIEFLKQRP